MKILKRNRGWTLTELMMVLAILGIIMAGLSIMLVSFTRYWRLNTARTEIQRDARAALSLVNKNLREAKSSTVVIDQVSGEPPWSRVSFTSIDSISISYYQQSGKLWQTVAGKSVALSENLRTLRFSYPNTDDSEIISVSACFEKSTYEGSRKALQLSIEKVRIMN